MCLELWFENDWYFCSITNSGWFWKRLSRNNVATVTFYSQFRSRRTQTFFKIVFFKNFSTVKHLCWRLFLIKLEKEEAPLQVFSCEHSEIFSNSFLYRTTTSGGWFYRLDKVANCSVLYICRPSFINQKHNVEWFLLKRFAHVWRACSLHIISRNYSDSFLLINMQIAKACSK